MTFPAAGMIFFDKPQGWTSHDAAEAFRRMLPKGTKVGHCGTLDPLATGLLILMVGPCTRFQARMQGLDKIYSGVIRLGVSTDTGDIAGHVLATQQVPALSLKELQEVLNAHTGTLQMPAPVFSAVKHQGKPLYKYARQGIAVPHKLRTSTVYKWEGLSYSQPDLEHRLSCSSGTYVRSLAELIGKKLGCGATVYCLRRDRIADFSAQDALTLEQIKGMSLQSLKDTLAQSLPRLGAAIASGILQSGKPAASSRI